MADAFSCEEVKYRLSDYLDECLDAEESSRIDSHVAVCLNCRNLVDSLREVVKLAGSKDLFRVPSDFSAKIYAKLDAHLGKTRSAEAPREVPLGITPDMIPVGTHLIHFWQTQNEFVSGVRFLLPSLETNEHCIVFGHDEALENVQETLREFGYDPTTLVKQGKLTVLRRHAAADQTIAEIGAAIESALHRGASMVRFLGNLGLGKSPLPAGEDDVLALEAKADALCSQLPVIIVCMYDVRTLPGKLIVRGGLQTHGHIVSAAGVGENPFYVGDRQPDADPHRVQ